MELVSRFGPGNCLLNRRHSSALGHVARRAMALAASPAECTSDGGVFSRSNGALDGIGVALFDILNQISARTGGVLEA